MPPATQTAYQMQLAAWRAQREAAYEAGHPFDLPPPVPPSAADAAVWVCPNAGAEIYYDTWGGGAHEITGAQMIKPGEEITFPLGSRPLPFDPRVQRVEFVPPGDCIALIFVRMGQRHGVSLLWNWRHWALGLELGGRGAYAVMAGPLALCFGAVQEAES